MTSAQSSYPVDPPGASDSVTSEWLPTIAQMENALRLRFDQAPGPGETDPAIPSDSVLYASMRQGMGLIMVSALIAGLLPFLWDWIWAGRMGTVVPFANLQQSFRFLPDLQRMGIDAAVGDAFQTLAGLPPALFPGWLAAGISAFGLWVNQPLQWLMWWIVYGLAVLLVAKMLGATTTLQQFYTVTSFGFLPLILTVFRPIPCLGPIISLLALVWAFVVYLGAVRSVTRLSLGMSALAIILPAATLLLIGVVFAVGMAATVAGVVL